MEQGSFWTSQQTILKIKFQWIQNESDSTLDFVRVETTNIPICALEGLYAGHYLAGVFQEMLHDRNSEKMQENCSLSKRNWNESSCADESATQFYAESYIYCICYWLHILTNIKFGKISAIQYTVKSIFFSDRSNPDFFLIALFMAHYPLRPSVRRGKDEKQSKGSIKWRTKGNWQLT